MNTVRLHVRGQMGVQILQASYALASLNDDEEPIVCVNHGGLTNAQKNKLDLLFEPNCRIINIDSHFKTPYWVEGASTQIFTNREKIFRWLKPKIPETIITTTTSAVHIRGTDKPICSIESLKYLVSLAPEKSIIYTDDIRLAESVTKGLLISKGDAFVDWVDMYHSPELYAAPSSFIMSMLIFNPQKKIKFLSKKYCDGTYPHSKNDILFLDEAKKFCPNLEIIQ